MNGIPCPPSDFNNHPLCLMCQAMDDYVKRSDRGGGIHKIWVRGTGGEIRGPRKKQVFTGGLQFFSVFRGGGSETFCDILQVVTS